MTKKVSHKPTGKVCSWFYCINCGLVYLKNEATLRAIKEGCKDDRSE